MKKQILFTIVVILVTTLSFSQKKAIRASSVDVSVGYVGDGVGVMVSSNYHVDRWSYVEISVFGASAVTESDLGNRVPYDLYMLQVGYFRRLWEQYTFKKYALFIGGGAFIGHEILNNGKDLVKNGESIEGVSQPVYGPYLGAAGEMRITDNFLLLIKGYGYYHTNSHIGNLYAYVGGGIRYFLF